MLFKPAMDVRESADKIMSRIGIEHEATLFDQNFDFFDYLYQHVAENKPEVACILIDEAQFLTKTQAFQLTRIVDVMDTPVLAYGLRTDFKGEPFEGSKYLLAWAENLEEIKTICHCGRKAIMNVRIDESGNPVREGEQVEIGGNERYIATCRRHYHD